MNARPIAIYYEHPSWFTPLFSALDRRGVAYEKLDAVDGCYSPDDVMEREYPVFFNRMSASAWLRGATNAIFFTRPLLAHLERNGVRVINGAASYEIEISKAHQLNLLRRLNLPAPRTQVTNSVARMIPSAEAIGFPLLVKPNIGGRGAGIIKFDRLDELRAAIDQGLIEPGIDNTMLIQEFVPKRDGHICRVETLGKKFLYAIRIFPGDEDFNLCPAEACQLESTQPDTTSGKVANRTSTNLCVVDGFRSGLRIEPFQPSRAAIDAIERIVAAACIDVGGVEYMVDDRTGEMLFYDVNALSNFVADAENVLGFDPHENLVDFLQQESN